MRWAEPTDDAEHRENAVDRANRVSLSLVGIAVRQMMRSARFKIKIVASSLSKLSREN
jgi:hypothetical protein